MANNNDRHDDERPPHLTANPLCTIGRKRKPEQPPTDSPDQARPQSAIRKNNYLVFSNLQRWIASRLHSPSEDIKPKEVESSVIKDEGTTFTEHFSVEQMEEYIQSLRECAVKNPKQDRKILCTMCGVATLTFEPAPLSCSNCFLPIRPNAFYYIEESESPLNKQPNFCKQCFKSAKIIVDGIPIQKTKLRKMKHEGVLEEPGVQCYKCDSWQHQICSLFNNRKNKEQGTPYTCHSCYVKEIQNGERVPLPVDYALSAKSLPSSTLSGHLELRLASSLQKERQQRAQNLGVEIAEVPTAENLTIRVVSSFDKSLQVSEKIRGVVGNNYPLEFSYRSKAIVLFQKIEQVDVILLIMYVQEYGSECPAPNHRHVHLSYLDSIKYFRPDIKTATGEALRTFVYHEILIGYLEHAKMRGFTTCYIWASPPMKGDDYVFRCHPDAQKIPKWDKLSAWYQAMLRKAMKEHIVEETSNFYDQFFQPDYESKAKITAARLPYFDGDCFPGAIDDNIDCIMKDMKQEKQPHLSNRAWKALNHAADSCECVNLIDVLVMQKIGKIIEEKKKCYILAHLQPLCAFCSQYIIAGEMWKCSSHCVKNMCKSCDEEHTNISNSGKQQSKIFRDKHKFDMVKINDIPLDTTDKDATVECEIFNLRQNFLNLCIDKNYQFNTLRHAKYSTMMCLHDIYNPSTSKSQDNQKEEVLICWP